MRQSSKSTSLPVWKTDAIFPAISSHHLVFCWTRHVFAWVILSACMPFPCLPPPSATAGPLSWLPRKAHSPFLHTPGHLFPWAFPSLYCHHLSTRLPPLLDYIILHGHIYALFHLVLLETSTFHSRCWINGCEMCKWILASFSLILPGFIYCIPLFN